MKKTGIIVMLMIFCIFVGCGNKDELGENTVEVSQKGWIKATVHETFDKDYYDKDELQDMLEQEVVEFNAENGKDSVEVDSFKVSGGSVKIIMNYSNWADYAHFNDVQFFAGKVSDIQGKNYGTNVSFVSRDGSETAALYDIDGDYYVILLEEKLVVQTPGKIVYVSDNVTVEGEKLARVNEDASGLAYVIYSK